ncbi:MAG TPA: hypothetical protein VFV75_06490 [Candidatus Polarisedimenticolaceae bacterium]|nr:hypothetical protein [Candidatus Polarisedimenticolaceae bacterium]
MRPAGALWLMLALVGCAGRDPGREVVAELGALHIERADLDAAIAAALGSAGALEDPDRDRVCSRLLDVLLEERLLAEEARRRGVTVSEADVRAYLADLPPGAAVADPERARRHIAARKLQDALLRAVGPPSEGEVELLAGRLRQEAETAGASVVVRALRLGSEQEAADVERRVQTGETTFERESAARDPGAAAPLQVSLGRLPPEVGQAVTPLQPGQITAPVKLHAGVYLFQLVSRDARGDAGRDFGAEARQELLRRRGEMALRALLGRLRRDHPVRLHRERLGFRYVDEAG